MTLSKDTHLQVTISTTTRTLRARHRCYPEKQPASSSTRTTPSWTPRASGTGTPRERECTGPNLKCRHNESSLASESQHSNAGPTLPPIYFSVQSKRVNKLAVRHLDGSACYVAEGTTFGAPPVCTFNQIGSFANSGDKRHNHTAHRHDHSALHNISMSFDPCTLTCKACQGAHQVLRRTIEGNDVGQDNPPVFVLVDQNFPPLVLVGGEGECLKIIQAENGSLTELVEVFLGLTRGFDVPAGAVVLLSSSCCRDS